MFESRCCREVQRQLLFHGLPAVRIDRVMRELAEHWEDLRAAALEEGFSETDAVVEADKRLGEPEQLAAEVIAGLRRGSWLGRHPILSVCVLPLLLPLLLMGVVAMPLYWFGKLTGLTLWYDPGPADVALMFWVMRTMYYAALIASVLWLCWRCWASGLGVRWVVAICSWCALAAILRFFDADPVSRNLVVGFSFPFRLNSHTAVTLLIHAVMAGTFLLAARRLTKRAIGPSLIVH